jgi:archaemetzincin
MIGVYHTEKLNLYPIVRNAVKIHMNMDTEDAGTLALPQNAYNPLRQQYDARTIATTIAEKEAANYAYTIGYVDVDIYVHNMNFIFGLADPVKKTALVSTFRLAGEQVDERVVKETVHELGHLKGLQHCTKETCVMHFSTTLSDTDGKKGNFCSDCRSRLA